MPQIIVGADGVNRKVKKIPLGVSGVNRDCKEAWAGVGGVNRKVFSRGMESSKWAVVGNAFQWYPSARIDLAIRWVNDRFILFCPSASSFLYSFDGLAWLPGTLSAPVYDIEYYGGYWIAVGHKPNSFIYRSTNFTNWETMRVPYCSPDPGIEYAVCLNGVWLIAAISGAYLKSADYCSSWIGSTWYGYTGQHYGRPAVNGNTAIRIASFNDSGYYFPTPPAARWESTGSDLLHSGASQTSLSNTGVMEMTYGNGIYLGRSSNHGETAILYGSTDGVQFSQYASVAMKRPYNGHVCYGDGRFILPPYSGQFAYSEDGRNWTVKDGVSAVGDTVAITYGAGKFVGVSRIVSTSKSTGVIFAYTE